MKLNRFFVRAADKMVPYDASASVPMVIYDARPGRQNPKAGPTIERTTQLIDIFPT